MFSRILVPLDGSETAEITAVPYAVDIALKFDAEIFVVCVAKPADDRMKHLFELYLERIAEKVRHGIEQWKPGCGVRLSLQILSGDPAEEILRFADEIDASLIAISGHRLSGGSRWPLGTVSNKVIRATPRPVLVTRSQASEETRHQQRLVKRVLLPLDGSQVAEAALPYAEILTLKSGAELILCHIVEWEMNVEIGYHQIPERALYDGSPSHPTRKETPEATKELETRATSAEAYLQGVGQKLQEKGINTSLVVRYGSIADQILDYAEANDIDLITMCTHGRSGVARWFSGSVTDKVLHAGNTPLLVVRPAIEKSSS